MAAARALATQSGADETDDALAAFGLRRDEECKLDNAIMIWPEHWKAVRLFAALVTQWRVGMAGAVGLDYVALAAVARMLKIKVTSRRLEQLQLLESETLRIMAQQRG